MRDDVIISRMCKIVEHFLRKVSLFSRIFSYCLAESVYFLQSFFLLSCRWCLFPPDTPKELLKPSHGEAWKQKGEAITWFAYVYPKVSTPDWPEKYKMVGYG